MRYAPLVLFLFWSSAGIAENKVFGTVTATLDGVEREWISTEFYGEPTSTYMGEPSSFQVTITAYAKPNDRSAGDIVSIDFGVSLSDPENPQIFPNDLNYNPTNQMNPHYLAQYENFELSDVTIEMQEEVAVVAGSFTAKLVLQGSSESSGEFSEMIGKFNVEVHPYP